MLSRRRFLSAAGAGVAGSILLPSLLAHLEAKRAPAPGGAIQLNSNENAYGPFPSAKAAMRNALEFANRYPDVQEQALYDAVAKLHGVTEDNLVFGSGSNDTLRMAVAAYSGPGTNMIAAVPTFEAPLFYAQWRGMEVIKVPLTKDLYAHDLAAMAARINDKTRLIYICNPNNPTGSITPAAELENFVEKVPEHVKVIIDEAYYHLIWYPKYQNSYLDRQPAGRKRVIVMRTFSKIYGMAGIRLGYAVADQEVIKEMRKYASFDVCNMIACLSGTAALADTAALKQAAERNHQDRMEFTGQATKRGIPFIPTYANFVMMESGRPVRQVIDHFKKNNILVGRPFPPLDTHVRVSLGLPPEMEAFWRAWDAMKA